MKIERDGSSSWGAVLRTAVTFWRFSLFGALAFALLMSSIQPAAAQNAAGRDQPISVQLEQFKVIKDQSGNEQLVDASSVRPGDVVEYRATYLNRTKLDVKGVMAVLPIPEGTIYQAESAAPVRIAAEAATKNKAYAPEPLMRRTVEANGTVHEEAVPYDEYRSLRWPLGKLAAGEKATVSVRVQVAPLRTEPRTQEAADSAATASPARTAFAAAAR